MSTTKTDIARIDGFQYKIGAHGHVYLYINGDWVRNSKPKHLIEKALEKAEMRGAIA